MFVSAIDNIKDMFDFKQRYKDEHGLTRTHVPKSTYAPAFRCPLFFVFLSLSPACPHAPLHAPHITRPQAAQR